MYISKILFLITLVNMFISIYGEPYRGIYFSGAEIGSTIEEDFMSNIYPETLYHINRTRDLGANLFVSLNCWSSSLNHSNALTLLSNMKMSFVVTICLDLMDFGNIKNINSALTSIFDEMQYYDLDLVGINVNPLFDEVDNDLTFFMQINQIKRIIGGDISLMVSVPETLMRKGTEDELLSFLKKYSVDEYNFQSWILYTYQKGDIPILNKALEDTKKQTIFFLEADGLANEDGRDDILQVNSYLDLYDSFYDVCSMVEEFELYVSDNITFCAEKNHTSSWESIFDPDRVFGVAFPYSDDYNAAVHFQDGPKEEWLYCPDTNPYLQTKCGIGVQATYGDDLVSVEFTGLHVIYENIFFQRCVQKNKMADYVSFLWGANTTISKTQCTDFVIINFSWAFMIGGGLVVLLTFYYLVLLCISVGRYPFDLKKSKWKANWDQTIIPVISTIDQHINLDDSKYNDNIKKNEDIYEEISGNSINEVLVKLTDHIVNEGNERVKLHIDYNFMKKSKYKPIILYSNCLAQAKHVVLVGAKNEENNTRKYWFKKFFTNQLVIEE